MAFDLLEMTNAYLAAKALNAPMPDFRVPSPDSSEEVIVPIVPKEEPPEGIQQQGYLERVAEELASDRGRWVAFASSVPKSKAPKKSRDASIPNLSPILKIGDVVVPVDWLMAAIDGTDDRAADRAALLLQHQDKGPLIDRRFVKSAVLPTGQVLGPLDALRATAFCGGWLRSVPASGFPGDILIPFWPPQVEVDVPAAVFAIHGVEGAKAGLRIGDTVQPGPRGENCGGSSWVTVSPYGGSIAETGLSVETIKESAPVYLDRPEWRLAGLEAVDRGAKALEAIGIALFEGAHSFSEVALRRVGWPPHEWGPDAKLPGLRVSAAFAYEASKRPPIPLSRVARGYDGPFIADSPISPNVDFPDDVPAQARPVEPLPAPGDEPSSLWRPGRLGVPIGSGSLTSVSYTPSKGKRRDAFAGEAVGEPRAPQSTPSGVVDKRPDLSSTTDQRLADALKTISELESRLSRLETKTLGRMGIADRLLKVETETATALIRLEMKIDKAGGGMSNATQALMRASTLPTRVPLPPPPARTAPSSMAVIAGPSGFSSLAPGPPKSAGELFAERVLLGPAPRGKSLAQSKFESSF